MRPLLRILLGISIPALKLFCFILISTLIMKILHRFLKIPGESITEFGVQAGLTAWLVSMII